MNLLFLALVPFFSVFDVVAQSSTLQFVQIWFRHGQRLPTHYLRFPNSSQPEFDLIDLAYPGELTNVGIRQEYELGKRLRKYYGKHFGEEYRPPQFHVWTGKDNRTSVSAQALLAGFWPPSKKQSWSSELDWMPIAIQTDESIDWVSTGVMEDCPVYKQTFASSKEYLDVVTNIENSDMELVQLCRNNTGKPLESPLYLNRCFDSLKIRAIMNDSRLPVPSWAKGLQDRVLKASYMLHGGVLDAQNNTVGQYHNEVVLSFFEDYLRRDTTKGVFVSSHDTNIVSIWKSLSLEGHIEDVPDFGAHLAVELHKIDNKHVLKFWLSMGYDQERRLLIPKFCAPDCTLERMQNIVFDHRKTRSAWFAECKGIGDITQTTSTITGSMIILLAALILSTIILGCTTFSYKRQLNNMRDPERSRLLE